MNPQRQTVHRSLAAGLGATAAVNFYVVSVLVALMLSLIVWFRAQAAFSPCFAGQKGGPVGARDPYRPDQIYYDPS